MRIRAITDTSGVSDGRLMQSRLEEVRTEVLGAVEHLHRVARRLHPPELDDLGLEAAITAHARGVEQASGLMVDIALAQPLPRLEPEARLAVFRIIQEALGNAAKHARARQVEVALAVADDRLEVEIHDDGQGFEDLDPDTDREGLGLSGMLDRAAHAGGTLRVDSHPGEGTRVTLSVPIMRPEASRNGRGGRRLTTEAPKPVPERVGMSNSKKRLAQPGSSRSSTASSSSVST